MTQASNFTPPSRTRPYNPAMQKIGVALCVLFTFVGVARADEIKWIVRPPVAGVKEGDVARIELIAVNAQETTQPLNAPAVLTGDLGEAGNKIKIELKRFGESPKVVPSGGFVAVPYDMVVPNGVGERVFGPWLEAYRTPVRSQARNRTYV